MLESMAKGNEKEPDPRYTLDPNSVRDVLNDQFDNTGETLFQKLAKYIYTESDHDGIEVFNRDRLPWQSQNKRVRIEQRNVPRRRR